MGWFNKRVDREAQERYDSLAQALAAQRQARYNTPKRAECKFPSCTRVGSPITFGCCSAHSSWGFNGAQTRALPTPAPIEWSMSEPKRLDPAALTGDIVGFRQWQVLPVGEHGYELYAAGRVAIQVSGMFVSHGPGDRDRHRWRRGQFTEAICDMRRHPDVPAPVHGCTCGLYAKHERISDYDWISGRFVSGLIQAHGQVEVHHDGFRAQYARPVALFLLPEPAGRVHNLAAREIAQSWELELVNPCDKKALDEAIARYGQLVPEEHRPAKMVDPYSKDYFGQIHRGQWYNRPTASYGTGYNTSGGWLANPCRTCGHPRASKIVCEHCGQA